MWWAKQKATNCGESKTLAALTRRKAPVSLTKRVRCSRGRARQRLKMKMNFLRFASQEFLRAGGFPPPAPLSRSSENEVEGKLINYENGARGEANALHSAASLRPLVFFCASRSFSLSGIYFPPTDPCAGWLSFLGTLLLFSCSLPYDSCSANSIFYSGAGEGYTQAVFFPPDAIVI